MSFLFNFQVRVNWKLLKIVHHVDVAIKIYVISTLTSSLFDRFIDCTISNRKGWISAQERYFLFWQYLIQKENWHNSWWFFANTYKCIDICLPKFSVDLSSNSKMIIDFSSYFELMSQWAWQVVTLSRLISIFTSKNVCKFLIKIQLTKSNSKFIRR